MNEISLKEMQKVEGGYRAAGIGEDTRTEEQKRKQHDQAECRKADEFVEGIQVGPFIK